MPMKSGLRIRLILTAAIVSASPAAAAVPTPNGFGEQGIALLVSGDAVPEPSAIAVERDGSVVVATDATVLDGGVVIFRVAADGTRIGFARSHGPRILPTPSSCAPRLAVDAGARLLVACGSMVVRLNLNGKFDASFGSRGSVQLPVASTTAIALVHGGGLILAGAAKGTPTDGLLVRLTRDGRLDPVFGAGGVVTLPGRVPSAIAVDAQGRILVTSGSVFRYTASGAPDVTFGAAGQVTVPGFTGQAVALDPAGRIVVAGDSSTVAVVRLRSDGTRDPSFGTLGMSIGDTADTVLIPGALVVEKRGAVIVAGSELPPPGSYGYQEWLVQRFRSDGSLGAKGETPDYFDPTDCRDETPHAIALQPDGKLVVAGTACETSYAYLFALRYDIHLRRDAGAPLMLDEVRGAEATRDGAVVLVTARVALNAAARVSVTVRRITHSLRLLVGSRIGSEQLPRPGTTVSASFAGKTLVRIRLVLADRSLVPRRTYLVAFTARDGHGRTGSRDLFFTAP